MLGLVLLTYLHVIVLLCYTVSSNWNSSSVDAAWVWPVPRCDAVGDGR